MDGSPKNGPDTPALPSKTAQRFFTLPDSTAPVVKAISQSIEKQNEKHQFLETIVQRTGYPLWSKAKIVSLTKGTITGREASGADGEVVYIPFVKDSANHVGGVLAVKLNASDTTYRMLYDFKYAAFGFDTTNKKGWNARDIFNLFASFDNSVFGHSKFLIKDHRLFGSRKDSGTVIATLQPKQSGSTINGREQLYAVQLCATYQVCDPSWGSVVRTTNLDGPCSYYNVCTTYYFDFGGGSGSVGTGDGTGNPSGGGSGGGGSNSGDSGWYNNPCDGSGILGGRTAVALPCDNGSGWVPVPVVHDLNWYMAQPPYTIDYTGLASYPCTQGIVTSVVGLQNSTINLIENVFSQSTKYNLSFNIDPTLTAAGSTHREPRFYNFGSQNIFAYLDVTINLSYELISRGTKFSIAQTVMHEMIHAYFSYRSIDANGDPVKEAKLAHELGFLEPYDPNADTSRYGDQHEQMASKYIQEMVVALKEYKFISEQDLTDMRSRFPNLTLDEYYEAMAWSGLNEDDKGSITKAWDTFKKKDPNKAFMYNEIIQEEQIGGSKNASKEKCF